MLDSFFSDGSGSRTRVREPGLFLWADSGIIPPCLRLLTFPADQDLPASIPAATAHSIHRWARM